MGRVIGVPSRTLAKRNATMSSVVCPHCSAELAWQEDLAGREVRCSKCSNLMLMPEVSLMADLKHARGRGRCFFVALGVVLLFCGCCILSMVAAWFTPSEIEHPRSEPTTGQSDATEESSRETVPAKVVFDIPSLRNKDIDAIVRQLGPPDPGSLEDRNGTVVFTSEEYAILSVDYDETTRKVKWFFLDASAFEAENSEAGKRRLLAMCNLKSVSGDYSFEFVENAWDRAGLRGVRIFPRSVLLEPIAASPASAPKPKLRMSTEAAKRRTWTSGEYTVEAEFITAIGNTVRLKRLDNGREITVPMDALSKEDQEFITKRKWRRAGEK